MMPRIASVLFFLSISPVFAEPVKLVHEPALSPDGKTVAFGWRGDVWTVPLSGGNATRLTQNEAVDSSACFSPDGKSLAFCSDRSGSKQIYVIPAAGGEPRQLTWHTEGYDAREWTPDGKQILAGIVRDYSWGRESRSGRAALVSTTERKADELLFDDYCSDCTLSADGQKLLFMREGEIWWRQGYKGSRGGQIWLYNRADKSFKQIKSDGFENRSPLWRASGQSFVYLCNKDGTLNLWEHDLTSGKDVQLTHFKGDSVVFPAISRDGSTVVFRNRFDLYRLRQGDKEPVRIDIQAASDLDEQEVTRLLLDKATDVSFTTSGLEVAFVAGGDVWVMDTELREPRQVTNTPEEERGVRFAPDSRSLWFVSDAGGETDVWRAEPQNLKRPWFENKGFILKRVTNDPEVEADIRFTPDGKSLAYVKSLGDLWIASADGSNPRRLLSSWNPPSYQFSPDGKWIVYSEADEWFNEDIWLMPVDGSKPPFNLSRHPSSDSAPVWSPDGKAIAWTGQRQIDEVDIFYVWLRSEDEEKTKRERTLEKAREKFYKSSSTSSTTNTRKRDVDAEPQPAVQQKPATPTAPTAPTAAPAPATATPPQKSTPRPPPQGPQPTQSAAASTTKKTATPPEVKIDFADIHERIHRINVPNTSETDLVWSPDGKKLAFAATVEGKRGTYTVELPDETKPKLVASISIASPRWLRADDQIVGLAEGRPVSLATKTGSTKTLFFRARQTVNNAAKQRAVFDQCWRVMRDRYYDEKHGNRDWNAVRAKYADMAATASDMKGVVEVVWLMLGELNGSHLGFTLNQATVFTNNWKEGTAHLGVRFDASFAGPGWKVALVLQKGPASQKLSRMEAGEVILKVDGRDVSPGMDPTLVLNGPLDRDIQLHVRAVDGKERDMTLRPTSYSVVRGLLYEKWIKDNRSMVETQSKGRLGYLHISAMDDASFQKFQEELYAAGAGKDGLIIDVRENGGGSTADHLLTALTQPQHSITVPRGGTPGYPQDRIIYATWSKPIVVLCNQNSYSNAEIFSHAIKQLKRGSLIGVPTAGGVISTGSASIMDVGNLRLPFRGWFGFQTGQDMELNGAQPDYIVWPKPGDMPQGKDDQLQKAIEVLTADVNAWSARPRPALIKATERK